jgi:hypothetical protein
MVINLSRLPARHNAFCLISHFSGVCTWLHRARNGRCGLIWHAAVSAALQAALGAGVVDAVMSADHARLPHTPTACRIGVDSCATLMRGQEVSRYKARECRGAGAQEFCLGNDYAGPQALDDSRQVRQRGSEPSDRRARRPSGGWVQYGDEAGGPMHVSVRSDSGPPS